ncbi:von Willebrand factor type A domain-containing protein [Paenibacillus pabuli]|uniref:von Willebrand factor type A domain-containing protein n=1 Tax=Paenibacillus pabuli TaxID=1472 RepID=A0ABX9BSL5_9BACL|nr:vWA domain-containing protein [Paenibacillus pabuli]RAJ03201.1 von Willebrand factor type A domain-containing protein [Paenibacillus pabuli]
MILIKCKKILLSLLMISILIPAGNIGSMYAESSVKTHAYEGLDAMFVLDVSYSMNETDKDRIAEEVIHMFMDMSSGPKTRLGFVAYNDQITSSVPLMDISSSGARNNLRSRVDGLKRSGYTDLGLGLRRGASLLEQSQTDKRKPFMILLSDGETDLRGSSSRTPADSSKDVDKVIEMAQKANYPIYTVGLNRDGTVNPAELERIAQETGGSSFITGSADDLPEIFNRIFADQIQSVLVSVAAVTATGAMQEVTVDIPNSSMADANIIMLSDHAVSEAQLYYQSSNVSFIRSDKYALMKIIRPVKGQFKLKFKGRSGDLVKINLLGNYNVSAVAHMATEQPVKGKSITFEASLYDQAVDPKPVQDLNVYKGLEAELIVTPSDGKTERIPLTNTGSGFTGKYTFPKSDLYTWGLRIDGPDFYREITPVDVDITNQAPVATGESMVLSKDDSNTEVDLSNYFKDANNDPLTYALAEGGSERKLGDAVIEGNILRWSSLHTGSSSIKVTATDSEGASITTDIQLKIHSLREKILLYTGLGLLAAGGIFALYWFVLKPKPVFRGRLEGYFLATANGEDIPVTNWPLTSLERRKVSLSELFDRMDIGVKVPESGRIWLEAGKKETLLVRHDTNCTVVRGRTPVKPRHTEALEYNEKLYITFEDGVTEFEIRYKAIKPSTNIYVGQKKDPQQAMG